MLQNVGCYLLVLPAAQVGQSERQIEANLYFLQRAFHGLNVSFDVAILKGLRVVRA